MKQFQATEGRIDGLGQRLSDDIGGMSMQLEAIEQTVGDLGRKFESQHQPLAQDVINLKQDYGILKQDIEGLSEGGNLLTGGSRCHQCNDPGFKSLEQELNKYFQELSDLRAERDSVIERYAQEKETQVKRLQGIFGPSSNLIAKAEELSDRNREFEEEVICEQGKEFLSVFLGVYLT